MRVVEKPARQVPAPGAGDLVPDSAPLPVLLRIPEWTGPEAPDRERRQGSWRASLLLGAALVAAVGLWTARWQGWFGQGVTPIWTGANGTEETALPSLPAAPMRKANAAPPVHLHRESQPAASPHRKPARLVPVIVPVESGGTR